MDSEDIGHGFRFCLWELDVCLPMKSVSDVFLIHTRGKQVRTIQLASHHTDANLLNCLFAAYHR